MITQDHHGMPAFATDRRLFTWRMLLDCYAGEAQIISSVLRQSRETLLCGGRPDRVSRPERCLDVDVDVGALRLR
jgi:hypothetical protein